MLLALPLGQLVVMPFSGRLVTRFGSRRTAMFGLLIYAFCLTNLGLASEPWHLAVGLFSFGLFGNVSNIAVNTQGIYTETLLNKNVMSAFHGTWSLAGFTGAVVGLGMVALHMPPYYHFLVILVFVILIILSSRKYLIKAKEKVKPVKKSFFAKPDKALVLLGIVGFCCKASEGVMFDWSAIYFRDIVGAKGAFAVFGYASFMITMSLGRFIGDTLIAKLGRKRVLQYSGILISIGLFLSVLWPYLIASTLGFMLVGLGVATIVPTVYSLAGRSTATSAAEALTTVSSVSFLGFLLAPPVIGYIAEIADLRYSFAFIGIFGFLIAYLVTRMKNIA
jgi:MFS family permease